MNTATQTLQINDIKPIVPIPDLSVYLFYGLIFLALILSFLLFYGIFRYWKSRRETPEKTYLKILKNINFENQKESAYTISKYGKLLAKEERQILLYQELYQSLEDFKYKKTITKPISKKIKLQYETFLESVDV